MRARTPSGNGTASPFLRLTSAMLHTGHFPGKSETTPGHMGHQNSTSPMTTFGSTAPAPVRRCQKRCKLGHAPTSSNTPSKTRKKRKRTISTRTASQGDSLVEEAPSVAPDGEMDSKDDSGLTTTAPRLLIPSLRMELSKSHQVSLYLYPSQLWDFW